MTGSGRHAATDRARTALRGLAGLAGLLAALLGVPVGLIELGQGLPAAGISWQQLGDGLHRPTSDGTLLRVVGLLCWLLWAAFAVAVVIEVFGQLVARRRGKDPARVATGVPGLQRLARTLVLTAALLLPQRSVTAALAAPSPARPAAAAAMAQSAPSHLWTWQPGPSSPPQPVAEAGGWHPTFGPAPAPAIPTAARAPAVGWVRYVVQRYDSPWAIAERHLGQGIRWREIRDGAGRPLDDGRTGARIIHPGEELQLPTGALSPSGAPPIMHPSEELRLPSGSFPRSGAPLPVPAQPAPGQVAERPAGAQPGATTVTGPLSQPSPQPSPGQPGSATTVPDPSVPVLLNVTAGRRTHSSAANLLLESGLVGASALGVIRVLRHRQAQRRPAGRRIRLPGPALARSELALRAGERPDRVSLVTGALDLLATTLAEAASPLPTVLGVLVDDDALEVLLARPAPAPDPWSASAEGFRWRIAASAVVAGLAQRSAPLPALAAVGRAATGEADVLINLEAAGIVGIRGRPSRVAGLLHAVATHLIGAPWAAAVDLVLIGFPPGLIQGDRVRTAPSFAALHGELRATEEIMTAAVTGHGCADAFHGRVRGEAGDGWPPTVVLCCQPLSVEEAAWLRQLTGPGHSGVAAVVTGAGVTSGGGGARWLIDVDARPMPIDPLRLAVEPMVFDATAMDDIAELLEIAQDDSGATLQDAPYDRIDLSVERVEPEVTTQERAPQPVPECPADGSLAERLARLSPSGHNGDQGDLPALADPQILVRVLGTVEVDGAIEFKRAKGRELVVYLAMHPHGVGEAELDEALWPSRESRTVVASTRDSTVSVARSAIGGPARLLPAQGQGREKRYQLSGDVQSDWSRFCTLHRWGRDHRSGAALRAALELVRGRPFDAVVSGRTYGWIHTEGHGRHIEAEVADAADLAAGLYLASGDALAARWAARQGLLTDPYAERLWVRMMESADHLGESQEVERVMDEMDVVLELGGDFSGLHPNTLAAYDRLSRRRRWPVEI